MGLEQTAGFGEGHAPPEPVEHLDLELRFQLADVLRERGLAGVQRVCRPPIAPGSRHGEENLELAERHAGKHRLIDGIRKRYWRLWRSKRYLAAEDWKGGRAMIFRHFLNPATGCASYLFG